MVTGSVVRMSVMMARASVLWTVTMFMTVGREVAVWGTVRWEVPISSSTRLIWSEAILGRLS